jgi:hypothetical protein
MISDITLFQHLTALEPGPLNGIPNTLSIYSEMNGTVPTICGEKVGTFMTFLRSSIRNVVFSNFENNERLMRRSTQRKL